MYSTLSQRQNGYGTIQYGTVRTVRAYREQMGEKLAKPSQAETLMNMGFDQPRKFHCRTVPVYSFLPWS